VGTAAGVARSVLQLIDPRQKGGYMNYISELLAGREVVCVAADEKYNSAIFWADEGGGVFGFSREIGTTGPRTDYEELAAHFERMQRAGALVLVRGVRFSER
jgi:hypothetical protein